MAVEECDEFHGALPAEAPGAWCKAMSYGQWLLVGAPVHAGSIVVAYVLRLGWTYKVAQSPPGRPTAASAVALARPPLISESLKLLPFQDEGLRFLLARPSGMMSWPCGSGKTPAAIYWACADPRPCLVVTRAPTRIQWAREIRKFAPAATILVIDSNAHAPVDGVYPSVDLFLAPPLERHLTKRPTVATPYTTAAVAKRGPGTPVVSRLTAKGIEWKTLAISRFVHFADPPEDPFVDPRPSLDPGYELSFAPGPTTALPKFLIIGWEMMREYVGLLESLKIPNLVLDEVHKSRAHKRHIAIPRDDGSVRFEVLPNITGSAMRISAVAKRRLATTATPIDNQPKDLWAQLDLIEPRQWGTFHKSFGQRYCNARDNGWGGRVYKGVTPEHADELRERLAHVIHRVSADVARSELPSMRRQVTYLPPSELCDPGSGWKLEHDAPPNAKRELELRKAAAMKRKYIVGRVMEVLAPGGTKVLVFTGRKADCEKLAADVRAAVAKADLDPPPVVLWGHGDHSQFDRQAGVDEYAAAKSAVLVGTGEAYGESINSLQCTDLQIHAMLPITPGQVIQREGRVIRQGQDRPVLIEYVIAEGTIDERVAELLINKLPAVEQTAGNTEIAGMSKELSYGCDPAELRKSVLDAIEESDYVED